MTQPLTSRIEHIVVVMFENRSFDNMLGGLRRASPSYEGLTGHESNPVDPTQSGSPSVTVWQGPTGIDTMITPFPDPNEDFTDMTKQLFGANWAQALGNGRLASPPVPKPTMDGFVWNYLTAKACGGQAPGGASIMQYFAPGPNGNIPVTSALASAYAVSDSWFASGPVQTFPNRLFHHCGTPGADDFGTPYVNDIDYALRIKFDHGLHAPSVFSTLDAAFPNENNWKVYYQDAGTVHDVPGGILSALLVNDVRTVYTTPGQQQVMPFAQFATDIGNDALPRYALIEPRYFQDGAARAQSNHPGNGIEAGTQGDPVAISVCDGEAFLADIYNTLAANPAVFAKTLLIVIYDEHGGCYDHVSPPAAVSPFPDYDGVGFDYSRYGVRVPCLLINPYVNTNGGAAFRPAGDTPFDHTTIIRTVFDQFLPTFTSLTPRDQAAPNISGLIHTGEAAIASVVLPPLSCPVPPTYAPNTTDAPGSRARLMQKIASLPDHL